MNRRRAIPLLAMLTAVPGCVTEGPPKPGPPPRTLLPARLAIAAPNLHDSNENTYADTMAIVVYVFGDDPAYPAPFTPPGSFSFRLLSESGQELHSWTLPEQAAHEAIRKLAPGPGYVFRLSLLDTGTDLIPAGNARLVGVFRPNTGEPIRAECGPLLVGPVTPAAHGQR